MNQRFIVAEISKNYIGRDHMTLSPILSQSFEHVVNSNSERGYKLHSFQLHRMMVDVDNLNETIIAVFERRDQ